jgi:hypothetical protein
MIGGLDFGVFGFLVEEEIGGDIDVDDRRGYRGEMRGSWEGFVGMMGGERMRG